MAFQAEGLPIGGLVVSRRRGEEIVIEIGGQVVATVERAEITGPNRARLRIRAPGHVVIARAEVYGKAAPVRA